MSVMYIKTNNKNNKKQSARVHDIQPERQNFLKCGSLSLIFFFLDWHGRLSEWVTCELTCQAAAWKNFDDADKASFLDSWS